MSPVNFVVSRDCVCGVCTCIHTIAGLRTQLKPCLVFVELFMRGQVDTDWSFILNGVVFGYRVINRCCDLQYGITRRRRKRSEWETGILLAKFKDEYESGIISEAQEIPICTHNVFVVPKDDGGGGVAW